MATEAAVLQTLPTGLREVNSSSPSGENPVRAISLSHSEMGSPEEIVQAISDTFPELNGFTGMYALPPRIQYVTYTMDHTADPPVTETLLIGRQAIAWEKKFLPTIKDIDPMKPLDTLIEERGANKSNVKILDHGLLMKQPRAAGLTLGSALRTIPEGKQPPSELANKWREYLANKLKIPYEKYETQDIPTPKTITS